MFPSGRVSGSVRPFPRTRRSRAGLPPARQTPPSASHTPHFTRFLTCRRGAVALESALAVIPLVICLVGVFGIVQFVFSKDLLQRAAYQIAYSNALADSAASTAAELRDRYLKALNTEVGGFLNFALDGEGACSATPPEGSPPVNFCLTVTVTAYKKPSDILYVCDPDSPRPEDPSHCSNPQFGGDFGDMVVVTVVAEPQFVPSELQEMIFGAGGIRVTAVRRNERVEAA